MSCFTIFTSVSEFSSFSASMKLQIVVLVQLTILSKPLCHPSARLEGLGSLQMVASHWFHPSLSKRGSEEDVPSHVYSMYRAKAAMSGGRRGLR